MNLINTKTHGFLDYLVSLILVASPWLFGFARGGAETWAPVAFGSTTIIYSFFTNYEPGLIRILSMRIHLVLDLLSALGLAFSPWIFGFSEYIWAPQVIIGALELAVVAMSVSVSGTEPKPKKFNGFDPMNSSR